MYYQHTYFFSFSIRQHSFERQTRFQMRPFIASVILYFFTGGCVSLVSLVSLPSPSALLSTSIFTPSSAGGNGAALEPGESSTDAVEPSTLLFSCFFSGGNCQEHSGPKADRWKYVPHAATLRSHSSFARGKPSSATALSSTSSSSCRFSRSAKWSGNI